MGQITDLYNPKDCGMMNEAGRSQSDLLQKENYNSQVKMNQSRVKPETKRPVYTAMLFHTDGEKEWAEWLELTRQQSRTGRGQVDCV